MKNRRIQLTLAGLSAAMVFLVTGVLLRPDAWAVGDSQPLSFAEAS